MPLIRDPRPELALAKLEPVPHEQIWPGFKKASQTPSASLPDYSHLSAAADRKVVKVSAHVRAGRARLLVVRLLKQRPMTIPQLELASGLSKGTLQTMLWRMRKAGWVITERQRGLTSGGAVVHRLDPHADTNQSLVRH